MVPAGCLHPMWYSPQASHGIAGGGACPPIWLLSSPEVVAVSSNGIFGVMRIADNVMAP